MPKLGMEPIRRKQLIEATVASISEDGFSNVTVSGISRRAGVSAGIIHHYFGGKNELLEATMHALLRDLRTQLTKRLAAASTPQERIAAIIRCNFRSAQFTPRVVKAWLAFWSQAPYVEGLGRLERINASRLQSNLRHALRPLLPPEQVKSTAMALAALIDGLSVRSALTDGALDADAACQIVLEHAECLLGAAGDSNGRDGI